MHLKNELTQQMKTAMKAGDKVRLSTVRMLLAELKNEEFRPGNTDDLAVLKRYAKALARAIDDFTNAGADQRAAQTQAELAIVEEFLPSMLTDDQLAQAIDAILAEHGFDNPRQMGQAMGMLIKAHPSQIDGAKAQQMLKTRLTGQ